MTKVFVVEDELFILTLFTHVLKVGGHEVVDTASDGEEAVQKYKNMETKPDIILMDQRLPKKNGIEAMKEILEVNPEAKFIFASADPSAEEEAMKSGAKSFLIKPFTLSRLLQAIEEAAK